MTFKEFRNKMVKEAFQRVDLDDPRSNRDKAVDAMSEQLLYEIWKLKKLLEPEGPLS